MCLSTPTISKAGTAAVEGQSNGNCCMGEMCGKNDQAATSSDTQLKHRGQATDATRKTKEQAELDDNLVFKKEDVIYKENAAKRELLPSKAEAIEAEVAYNPQIRWPDLIAQTFLHVGALYGVYLLFHAKLYTFLWLAASILVSGVGITAGAHRLWSHKSYTASLFLRIVLAFMFTIAGQRDAYTWALDHRIHHKFSETDADPHNAKRGFFFAHVGWLFLTPHPKVIEKRKVIDMSDLEEDAVVMFQRKYFIPLFALISIGLPVLVPWYFWEEDLWMSFWINFNMRFTWTLNVAFFVNSVAHMYGNKPYDKNITSVEVPIVSLLAMGEGWHNYHHVFPWDYKAGEFGNYTLNVTTAFIDFCARIGLASGRKSVSPDMVLRRAAKCGDGSRFLSDEYAHKDQVWGFGDCDLPREDIVELSKMQN
ncbi:acyl-CoA Delta-9 desaturase [Drosophila grimshawi]|uniref:GH18422 n=1 Tax=Drosophila grimshawi TaxID=7222 RepID=B4JEM9_DROGR|nr:acyl-CoA Delta-9 desaturase [Drosophila grimshawi]XP_032593053.1 acyl-CoA Delta-9 desaturase [Drosophila grimshawi]XP_032593054.1 acyl-CoA Delta-9 desaturase [Drosophila grimshawi]EDV93160.1 GH18422 [Drosophila grimshawi]